MIRDATYAQVDLRSNLSLREFRREYLRPGRPVVIRDAIDGWDKRVLSFAGLKETCGDEEVRVYRYDQQKEFTPDAVSHKKVGEIIDSVQGNDFKSYPFYMRDNWELGDKYQAIMNAHNIPVYFFDWFKFLPPALRMPYPRIFIGPKGAVTPLHVDVWNTHAWLSQLEGRKRWLLFSPADAQYLYEYSVRCEKPDLERFPLYANAAPLECTLEPGDTIFVPSKWSHWVESLDSSVSLTYNYMGPGCIWSCVRHLVLDVLSRVGRRLSQRSPVEA